VDDVRYINAMHWTTNTSASDVMTRFTYSKTRRVSPEIRAPVPDVSTAVPKEITPTIMSSL